MPPPFPLDRDPGNNHRPTTRKPRQPPNTPGKAKQTLGGSKGGGQGRGKVGGRKHVVARKAEWIEGRVYKLEIACFPFMGFMSS